VRHADADADHAVPIAHHARAIPHLSITDADYAHVYVFATSVTDI
jgi:hypothetical protein